MDKNRFHALLYDLYHIFLFQAYLAIYKKMHWLFDKPVLKELMMALTVLFVAVFFMSLAGIKLTGRRPKPPEPQARSSS